jgi:hypothetical protein
MGPAAALGPAFDPKTEGEAIVGGGAVETTTGRDVRSIFLAT